MPSSQPTDVPTSEPSTVPSVVPSGEPTAEPSSLPTALDTVVLTPELMCDDEFDKKNISMLNNETCLFVTLTDQFGDGWGNGTELFYWMQIRDDDSNVVSESLDCNCTRMRGCLYPSELNIDQRYHLTVESFDSAGVAVVPDYYWEIQWTVQVVENGEYKEKYFGG